MKLHLGCGQRYLEGYVNVDFPLSVHTVQANEVADLYADLLSLHYPSESVTEVRIHHVFEHFTRPVACALLAGWHGWLAQGGLLRIEVPDFHRTARVLYSPFASRKKKMIAIRHLFGSHEADWAVHCEGYTRDILQYLLKIFGYTIDKVTTNSWKGTYNLEIYAYKRQESHTRDAAVMIASDYLRNFLIDDSRNGARLHDVWMQKFKDQFDRLERG